MGKRREISTEEDVNMEVTDVVSHKRHKRHKHKKQQKPVLPVNADSDGSLDISSESEMINMKSKSKTEIVLSAAEKLKAQTVKMNEKPVQMSLGVSPKVKRKRKRESGTSSEEERWLDAIESGKLEEVDDELKKIKPKDPKLMTARQRAMYERGSDKEAVPGGEVLMALPSGYKEKVMTAEAIQKAALKSQKRKQMADEKREKDKKKTMERLLKKTDTKATKIVRGRSNRLQVPIISYRNNQEGISVTFPVDMPCPLVKKEAVDSPKPVLCEVDGCTNLKRYTCNKTNLALCSLKCYKRNFELLRRIII